MTIKKEKNLSKIYTICKIHIYRFMSKQTFVYLARGNTIEGKRQCMVIVPMRYEDNLLGFIQLLQPPESITNSDCWTPNNHILNYGYAHCTVNHFQNFVNPVTNEHTQRIVSLWRLCKLFLQLQYYNKFSEIEKYIAEWCFRYNHNKKMYTILQEILKYNIFKEADHF